VEIIHHDNIVSKLKDFIYTKYDNRFNLSDFCNAENNHKGEPVYKIIDT